MRWIWIDRFLEFASGQYARAVKNVSLAEDHLHDHFPGYPVMPGSLIVEGFAQTGGILVGEARNFTEKVVLAKIPRVEFFGIARPGDQIIYEVELADLRSEGAIIRGRASINGQPLAEAQLVFAHLGKSVVGRGFGSENFVFADELTALLDLKQAKENAAKAGRAATPLV